MVCLNFIVAGVRGGALYHAYYTGEHHRSTTLNSHGCSSSLAARLFDSPASKKYTGTAGGVSPARIGDSPASSPDDVSGPTTKTMSNGPAPDLRVVVALVVVLAAVLLSYCGRHCCCRRNTVARNCRHCHCQNDIPGTSSFL